MYRLRSISIDDLDQLYDLASMTSYGLTTLPADRAVLERRIVLAEKSMAYDSHRPSGELYFFVLEDMENNVLVGTSAIISKIGGFEPYYAYELRTKKYHSRTLDLETEHQLLHLIEKHNGPSEIGSLFLHPDHRHKNLGKLLSLSRFLYMAEHRDNFENEIIAELRGVVDEAGRSPFWEAIGKHFFQIDFAEADYLSMVDKSFIADMMPKQPIYICTLPEDAQAVIGRVHSKTIPAMRILEKQGFKKINQVDIFEAGPTMQANLDTISSVRQSIRAKVGGLLKEESSQEAIVINTERRMSACISPIKWDGYKVFLPASTLNNLDLTQDSFVRYLLLNGSSE
ncbi:MAG: arginine N-succinyltransferase [Lentisphaeria bacterium]|nr:arginine N-succinyltransferase [Lentisphaeria bacterium]NQZ70376.1 arginine N-succinyltransferase [Lentisphaeria bacterium]